ncbi:Hypothetical predicted protein [Mytilus galloprovincialis]|uniref:Ig-like domain-containing protein n=1 Tax=Mytilus galloprovincialis TaxID=29158 RepID=A0A8B6FL71_MYTGA|nr:Hypothetical predicted protein [Mytilus galloprovincialis]
MKPPTNLKIVNAAEHTITYGKEGVRIELTCTVKNGIPATTLIWSKNGLTVANSSSDILLYRFIPTRSDHMQNITCYALSDLLTSPLSQTILLDIQYAPDVKIQYKISKQNIRMFCIADGNPNNYTFNDWEHKSEFNEHIRRIHGTPKGHLIINKAQYSKENEDDGIYVCTVSNGVPNMKGKFDQKGQTSIKSIAPPVFVADNKQVQIGHFGKSVEIEIYIYDKLNNSEVVIKSMGTSIMIKAKIKSVQTHDTFHGVYITVPGIKYTFDLDLTSENSFTKYTVEACNDVGCNYFDVQVKSANVGYKSGYNYGWYIVGSLFGGSFILSICLNIYCLVKRKKSSGIVSETPLEIHYDEIGTIHDNSESIQVLSNNAQGAVSIPERHAFERINSHVSDFEQEISSETSLQSLSNSLLNEDGYEHSYETINPENIEIHPYSTVWYNIYENTKICPKEITIKNKGQAIQIDNERGPWLIIYMKNV